jgi:hypothetical protein
MTVDIVIEQKPPEPLTDVEFIPDLDELIDSAQCSCSAGDNNPY